MKYEKPFFREKEDDRLASSIIPFIGGALIGGLVAYNINKTPSYYPPYNNYGYNNQPYYPYNNMNNYAQNPYYNYNQN